MDGIFLDAEGRVGCGAAGRDLGFLGIIAVLFSLFSACCTEFFFISRRSGRKGLA